MKTFSKYTQLRLAVWVILFGLVLGFAGRNETAVFANHLTKSEVQQVKTQRQVAVENLLKNDGTLDLSTGFNGSLDITGWQFTLGHNGEPHFEPAGQVLAPENQASADASLWDNRFHPPGLSIGGCQFGGYCIASANAIVVIGTDVYVGGDFTHAGPNKVNYIAKWDGNNWSALGEGVNGVVRTIVVDGNDLYVGGGFTQAGNVAANYIAKWNGTDWSPLGSGLNNQVYAIKMDGGKIYAGGYFTEAGGSPANRIAEWNGLSWTALGDGTNNTVRDIEVIGDNLYAGGFFTTAGTETVNYIARWDGLTWYPLESGVGGPVLSLASSGSNLFASVDLFSTTGGSNIDLWNGTNWSSIGNIGQERVFDLLAVGSDLYIAGNFSFIEGLPISNFARWNGTTWSGVGGSVGPQPQAIAFADGNFYLGGYVMYGINNNNTWVAGIARWDGTDWYPLDNGMAGGLDNIGRALAINGNNIYVGGSFIRAGATTVDKIAQWNGNGWLSMGDGVEDMTANVGKVEAIAILGQDVYVGGDFTSIGGILANSLAKWDGSQWSNLDGGVLVSGGDAGIVNDMVIDGNELYVGGTFTSVGGIPADSVAKWNGSQWVAIGGGISNSGAYALLIDGGTVYMGGNILLDGSVDRIYIAQLVGNSWQEIGDGFNDEVYALAMHNGELVAGGRFSMSGTTPINRIARWDGQNWNPLGDGLGTGSNEKVLDLESHGALYAGGSFTTTGSESSAGLATWDGMQWESFTVGIENPSTPVTVNDIEFQGNVMYIAGSFTEMGGQPAFNFAKWGFNEALFLPMILR